MTVGLCYELKIVCTTTGIQELIKRCDSERGLLRSAPGHTTPDGDGIRRHTGVVSPFRRAYLRCTARSPVRPVAGNRRRAAPMEDCRYIANTKDRHADAGERLPADFNRAGLVANSARKNAR